MNSFEFSLPTTQEKTKKEIGCKRKEKNRVLTRTTPIDFEDKNIALMTKRFSRIKKRGKCSKEGTVKKTLKIQ